MNWGNKLLITFIIFGAGIFYLVYRSMTTNFELVEKDYYKSELHYQNVIDGSNRAGALNSPVKLEQKEDLILLQLPEEMKNKIVTGDILFYCAYDQKKDKKFRLQVNDEGQQVFQPGIITPGNYTVKINWSSDSNNYYTEKTLIVF
jgi:FixH